MFQPCFIYLCQTKPQYWLIFFLFLYVGEVGKEMYICTRGRLQVVDTDGKTVLATLKVSPDQPSVCWLVIMEAGRHFQCCLRNLMLYTVHYARSDVAALLWNIWYDCVGDLLRTPGSVVRTIMCGSCSNCGDDLFHTFTIWDVCFLDLVHNRIQFKNNCTSCIPSCGLFLICKEK